MEKQKKKFVLTNTKKEVLGKILFQIKALVDFGMTGKGELWQRKEKEFEEMLKKKTRKGK